MDWLGFGIAALVALSGYNFVLKLTSPRISSLYALPFVALGVFVVSLVGLIFARSTNGLIFSRQGLWMAILTGGLWGVGQIFYFWMFSKGASFSIGLPFVIGGLVAMGAIVGVVVLKEPFSFMKMVGVVVIFAGLFILSRG